MAFEVSPHELRELAALLDRARGDAEQGRVYLEKIRQFPGGEGVLNQVVGGHHAVYQALDSWLGRVANPSLAAASEAVNGSATYYENTDTASAEKLDKTYPPTIVADARAKSGNRRLDMPASYAMFGDITEPAAFLVEPGNYHRQMNNGPSWWDMLSPMSHIGNAIETVSHVAVALGLLDHPYDPQAEMVRPFVGDWAAVRSAADVLRNLATSLFAVGNNITWASQGTEAVWKGNAGAGAAVHLMELAKPLNDIAEPLHRLADSYEVASGEMVKLRDAAVNIVNQVGDAAIQAAAACGVSAGAASTGIGTPVAIAAALFVGYKVHRVVDGIRSLMEVIGRLDALTSVLKAAQTEFGDLQTGVTLPALPDQPLTVPK